MNKVQFVSLLEKEEREMGGVWTTLFGGGNHPGRALRVISQQYIRNYIAPYYSADYRRSLNSAIDNFGSVNPVKMMSAVETVLLNLGRSAPGKVESLAVDLAAIQVILLGFYKGSAIDSEFPGLLNILAEQIYLGLDMGWDFSNAQMVAQGIAAMEKLSGKRFPR